MQVLCAGASGLLIELDDLDAVLGLSAALRARPPAGVVDIVPAARTILLHCDLRVTSLEAVAATVRRVEPSPHEPSSANVLEIPITYDGPDIDDVLTFTGMSRPELIQWHTGADWVVAFCGFAPGFGYLVSPSGLSIPRRDTPRTKVPAGSVGLAGEFSGIYPRVSPGGWQLIGRTVLRLFDLAAQPPAKLAPGIGIRFLVES